MNKLEWSIDNFISRQAKVCSVWRAQIHTIVKRRRHHERRIKMAIRVFIKRICEDPSKEKELFRHFRRKTREFPRYVRQGKEARFQFIRSARKRWVDKCISRLYRSFI